MRCRTPGYMDGSGIPAMWHPVEWQNVHPVRFPLERLQIALRVDLRLDQLAKPLHSCLDALIPRIAAVETEMIRQPP